MIAASAPAAARGAMCSRAATPPDAITGTPTASMRARRAATLGSVIAPSRLMSV